MGWPIFGHLLYFNPSNIYPLIEYYTKKYGPIFRIKLGSFECVVINDYKLIKKALSSQDFISRPMFFTLNLTSMEGHGLIWNTQDIWQEQRNFAVTQLRYLGMGKSSMVATVHEEINALFSEWKKTIGSPMEVNVSLSVSTTNIIWSIVAGFIKYFTSFTLVHFIKLFGLFAGKRMDYDDPKFLKLLGEVKKAFKVGFTVNPMIFIPWIPKTFFNLDYFTEIVNSFNNFSQVGCNCLFP